MTHPPRTPPPTPRRADHDTDLDVDLNADLNAMVATSDPSDTGTLPVVGPGPQRAEIRAARAVPQGTGRSDAQLLRTTGSMAVPTLISRITGFGKVAVLGYVVGLGQVSSAFNIANTLPQIISELVLGAVLTSIVVPVLVRAEREDADGGVLFTRRLVTLGVSVLALAAVLAVLLAPRLTALYVGDPPQVDPELVTLLAVLLLPQIAFHGTSALAGAVLNTKGVFGLVAWAPVLNNAVALTTLGVYALTPGELVAEAGNPRLLVLGVGTTLGIVAQATVLVLALRRAGVPLRPSWGLDARLRQFGGMAVAVLGYVVLSQIGYTVTINVASGNDEADVTLYQNAWLLLQVPYGILGVSLLTAIMPRMSRAAAAGDDRGVVADLSLGSRLVAVGLVPILVLFTVHGATLGTALFAYGSASGPDAGRLGETVASSAFGLLPYAVVLLQLRVFYARQQAWVPTAVMAVMVGVKVPLMLALPRLLDTEDVVLGLAAVNGLSFLVGSLLGGVLLRRALGPLGVRALLRTVGLVLAAALAGVAVDAVVSLLLPLDRLGGGLGALVAVVVHASVILGVSFGLLVGLRLPELDVLRPALGRLAARLRRRAPAAARTSGSTAPRPYPGPRSGGGDRPAGGRRGGAAVGGETEGRAGAGGTDLTKDTAPSRDTAPTTGAPATGAPTADAPTVAVPVAVSSRRPPVRGPRLVPGAAVAGGRYRLLAEHGGSGELRFWQARDTTLDRDVALTFVDAGQSAGGTDPATEGPQAVLSRTLRLGRLDTPGLARVLDVVRGSSGGIVVSEWTTGRSLREVAATSPSPVGAARAVRALAGAAESAHRAQAVLAIDHPDRVRISSTGTAVLAFPGVTAASDQHGDVQGLGAVLYALITDRWPLPAPGGRDDESPVGGMERAPLGRSGGPVEPRTLRSAVPFEISAVTMRSLQPDSGLRTAAAVQTVLEQAAVLDQQTDMFAAVTDVGPDPYRSVEDEPRSSDTTDDRPERRTGGGFTRGRKVALGVLALLVVGSLVVFGVFSQLFAQLGGGGDDPRLPSLTIDENGNVLSTTAAPAPGAEAPAAPEPAPAAGPVAVAGSAVFSPGGVADNPEDAGLAVDGDPGTPWRTDAYNEQFPALKDGVGLLLTVGAPTTVTSVAIDSPSAGTVVQVRSSPSGDPTLEETTVVGEATLVEGRTDIPVTLGEPTATVLVWITTLGNDEGNNQSTIGEITLTP